MKIKRRILSLFLSLLLPFSLPFSLSSCRNIYAEEETDAGDSLPITTPPPVILPEPTEPPMTDPALSLPPVSPSLFPGFHQYALLDGTVRVEILEAQDKESFTVLPDQSDDPLVVGWERITPTEGDPYDLPEVNEGDVTRFLQSEMPDFSEQTVLFLDLSRLTLWAFENGHPIRRMPVSAGDSRHPTPRGLFSVDYRTAYMGKTDAYLTRWAVRFYGDYMFHSVLYDWEGREIINGALSCRLSHGCVRRAPEDAKWVFFHIPDGSPVLIF